MDTKKLVLMASACVAIAVAVIFTPPSSPLGDGLGVTSADLVVKNALIYTSDPSHPWAESMAIRNNRILRIGGLSSLQALVGQKTQFLDLHGKVVVPGFIDSHVHFISGGLQMAQVDLHDVKSQVEFVRKVEQAVHGTKRGCWILGGGWNSENWGGELPQASWIDDVTPHHPVWLPRVDGHMGLANSVALAKAGIQNMTHDIGGGSIIRNADGGPSGLLVDAAMQLLLHHIPEVTIEERRDAMIRASNLALSRGVTTVVDFGRYYPGTSTTDVWQDFFDVYKWADATGNMLLRVCLFFPLETWSRVVDTLKASGRSLSQWLHIGGVKGFADGSLGSNSALFYEPYADDTNNYGIQVANPYFLLDSAIESDKSGVQVAIHAIGDKANDMVLSISKALILKHGVKDRRFRIEHAQHLSLGATDRFGANQVIASVQPQHLLDDAVSAIKKLGERRALQGSYLFHSLLLSNTRLAFGSDWPVANLDPLEGIKAATHRMPQNCSTSWIPSECVTVDAALDGFFKQKLGPHYYGSFQILKQIGEVAYALELPTGTRIYNVFHVSRLKQQIGDLSQRATCLPPIDEEGQLELTPEAILQVQTKPLHNRTITKYLIKWSDLPIEEATWETATALNKWSEFCYEDIVSPSRGGVLM